MAVEGSLCMACRGDGEGAGWLVFEVAVTRLAELDLLGYEYGESVLLACDGVRGIWLGSSVWLI